jgi:hypothetical protein
MTKKGPLSIGHFFDVAKVVFRSRKSFLFRQKVWIVVQIAKKAFYTEGSFFWN